ncbi:hypothetical protein RHMOL_Rhmol08G0211000 [Rhododendron molle]|uniref:Uncharacterized protein n=1 Tax=Rhododendron molle TaxID=49168 RepID=A0ACC0MSS8_RHOML|nr:hypothetical protein RHMOL_Rhmol08G0211000 [Rhododendron molle]
MYLPLLIRAAYVFLVRSCESRERGAHCPPCDDPMDKYLITAEMDSEVDYLYSLLEKQDMEFAIKNKSLTLEDQDFVEKEVPAKSNMEEEVWFEEPKLGVVERIDFLGVDDVDLVYHPYIADFV